MEVSYLHFLGRSLLRIISNYLSKIIALWSILLTSDYSSDQINKNEMDRSKYHVWGEKRDAYRILVEKPERKKPLDRPRRGWFRTETDGRTFECGNELSGSKK
jgi:hypothetical protein